jgi:transcriptional regulator with XRE-family HTH domain
VSRKSSNQSAELRALRKEAGLSRAALARKAPLISVRTLEGWESGKPIHPVFMLYLRMCAERIGG